MGILDDESAGSVREFFDSHSGEYGGLIERCVPRYGEMLWALLDCIPEAPRRDVLELGCGTGNLSVLLASEFPDAHIRLVDISPEMQKQCRARLGSSDRFDFETADFRELDYPPASFDLVISTIALHHLDSPAKAELFRRIHGWLRDDGVFTYSDQFAGATPDLYEWHMANWKREATSLGATEDEWNAWMRHQDEHDYHDPLLSQVDWLRDAGFVTIDCPWRFLLWTVVQARK